MSNYHIDLDHLESDRLMQYLDYNFFTNNYYVTLQGVKKVDKEIVNSRTTTVKDNFEKELGLIVDQRREGGFGNTNTGNVIRKAFQNSQKTAAICGVSTMLVSNLDVIRRTLASGYAINPEKFGQFCTATLEQYMADADWYDIPPTLHRILVHGKSIIEETPVPIGWTSEEGSEANNKFARNFLQKHSRKNSHKNTMTDLFHRLMDISDPFIVGLSTESQKESHKIPVDMQKLLKSNSSGSSAFPFNIVSTQSSFASMELDSPQTISPSFSLTDLSFAENSD